MAVAASQAPVSIAEDADEDNGAQSDIFSNYSCRSIDFGAEHPGDIAEAAGLALIPLPQATYPVRDSIPPAIIQSGKLSKLQLEGVLYACQRHLCFLPSGERCGFFIGDGAGVGKGRQISGIILDNWARGRHQHVWFSISRDLREDAQRDLNDLGIHLKVIDGCQELDAENKAFGLSSEFKEGVLFTTYSTLIGAARGAKLSRLDQIVAWCGGKEVERKKVFEVDKNGAKVQRDKLFAPNFAGILIFDECHRAKNFSVAKDNDDVSSDKSSQTAKCVIEIQQRMPKARVVYCSATGVTELSNLAYCERLGLWGKGLAFPNFEKFYTNASKRGVFFLEMLAMELKRSGTYVSRGLSFAQAEFETIYCELSLAQKREYDAAALLWMKVRTELQNAVAITGASNRTMSSYWGAHQRFFRQLILSFKVDFLVEKASRALEEGYAVVIGLQTTGEAGLARSLEKSGGRADDFISSAKESLISFIEQHFPTKIEADSKATAKDSAQAEDVPPADSISASSSSSQISSLPPSKAKGPPGSEVQQCVESKNRLLRDASSLQLPLSALDGMIDKLGGHSKVAEMTGRKLRLVRNEQGHVHVQQRGALDDEVDEVNINECSRFMKGNKHVAIISDAASTGISLHASQECQNRRRRVHFTVELPWSADKAVQQLGRSHRSNQASAPIYKLVVTNLGGERRFAAAVSKRLQSLGALTKGDRRAAAGQDLQEFDLDNQYGRVSLKRMFEAIDGGISVASGASAKDLQRIFGGGDVLSSADDTAAITTTTDSAVVALNNHFQSALEAIGFGTSRKDNDISDVKKFLGRLLGLPVNTQNAIYHYFFSVLGFAVSNAIKEGRYTDAIADLFGSESLVEQIKSEVIHTDHITGATCSVQTLRVDRGLSWQAALAKYEEFTRKFQNQDAKVDDIHENEVVVDKDSSKTMDLEDDAATREDAMHDVEASSEIQQQELQEPVSKSSTEGAESAQSGEDDVVNAVCDAKESDDLEDESTDDENPVDIGPKSGFYETKNFVPGRGSKGWLLALQSVDRPHLFMVGRPNSGMLRYEMHESELHEKYVKKGVDQAEAGWKKLYDDSVSFEVGARILTVHIVTGTLVPLWEQIEQVVRTNAFKKNSSLSKKELEMKVVRVKVDSQYIVGLKLPPEIIQSLKPQFKTYSLLKSGNVIQIAPPPINPSTIAQLCGQELPIPVQIVGQGGPERVIGVIIPLIGDPSSYRVRIGRLPDGRAVPDAVFKFGSVTPQLLRLSTTDDGGGDKDGSRMLVEPVGAVDARALSRAMTAKATMKSFFSVAERAPKPAAAAATKPAAAAAAKPAASAAASIIGSPQRADPPARTDATGYTSSSQCADAATPCCTGSSQGTCSPQSTGSSQPTDTAQRSADAAQCTDPLKRAAPSPGHTPGGGGVNGGCKKRKAGDGAAAVALATPLTVVKSNRNKPTVPGRTAPIRVDIFAAAKVAAATSARGGGSGGGGGVKVAAGGGSPGGVVRDACAGGEAFTPAGVNGLSQDGVLDLTGDE